MPFSGTTYSVVYSYTPGTTILSSQVNGNFTDVGSALTALASGTQYLAKIELGNASDTTLSRSAAGVMAVEAGAGSVYVAGVELGNASDTTLSRASAGVLSVEGKAVLGAVNCSFSANKNGSNQSVASSSYTKVTFGTEDFDVGSKFASSTWTPLAGTIHVSVGVGASSVTSEVFFVAVYKNGSDFREATSVTLASGIASATLSFVDQANGTDTYEVYVRSPDGSYTVLGATSSTWFSGTMV